MTETTGTERYEVRDADGTVHFTGTRGECDTWALANAHRFTYLDTVLLPVAGCQNGTRYEVIGEDGRTVWTGTDRDQAFAQHAQVRGGHTVVYTHGAYDYGATQTFERHASENRHYVCVGCGGAVPCRDQSRHFEQECSAYATGRQKPPVVRRQVLGFEHGDVVVASDGTQSVVTELDSAPPNAAASPPSGYRWVGFDGELPRQYRVSSWYDVRRPATKRFSWDDVSEADTSVWRVVYRVTGDPHETNRAGRVTLTRGYSTLADVDKILSIPLGVPRESITIIAVVSQSEQD